MGKYQVTHIQLGKPTTNKLKKNPTISLTGVIQKIDKDREKGNN